MSRPSVPFWVELHCRECSTPGWGRLVRTGRSFRDELVRNARNDGWVFAHQEAFCCQLHADTWIKRQQEKVKAAA